MNIQKIAWQIPVDLLKKQIKEADFLEEKTVVLEATNNLKGAFELSFLPLGDPLPVETKQALLKTMAHDTKKQLIDNFENVTGAEANENAMCEVFGFMKLFMAEIQETCPKSRIAHAASILNQIIDDSSLDATAHNIAMHRKK